VVFLLEKKKKKHRWGELVSVVVPRWRGGKIERRKP
jgi:hypothetical protein